MSQESGFSYWRSLLSILVSLVLWTLPSTAYSDSVRIDHAVLSVGEDQRLVNLPHTLDQADFDPDGSTVTYRLTVEMPEAPAELQAIYLSKVSLAARILSDGQPIWACGFAEWPELRCLHRPHLVQIPVGILSVGHNVFELEVYADSRQTNGVGAVVVGPYIEVFWEHYFWTHFLKVDLLHALGIIAGVTGLMCLGLGLVATGKRAYFVFGAVAILEAIALFLMTAVHPPGDKETASWLIFGVRYIGIILKLLLLYELFGRFRRHDPLVLCLMVLLVLGPVLMAVTGSNLWVVLTLYLFVGICMAATVTQLAIWTIADPSTRNILWTLNALVIFLASLHDYLRLGGAATFDGVYLLYYIFPLSSIIMGSVLLSQVGTGLRVAQDFNLALSQEVADRTSALESALASIRSMEASALSLTRNIPVGTFILHTWGRERARYAFFSDRLRQMINLPTDAEPPLLSGANPLLHPDDVKSVSDAFYTACDSLDRFESEFRVRNAAGKWRWLCCIMLPQPSGTSPVVWDGVVIDVTETRDAEDRLRLAHAGLVAAAAEQSRMEEREHLLREMHDGFGSQLSSARLAIEQGDLAPEAVARILLDCSQDLRIMVDTLGNADGDLRHAVADFRYRTDRFLFGTGIAVTWDIDVPDQTSLPPKVILHVLRVLQEAMNNALRHSGGQKITFIVKICNGQLVASVSDDGKGLNDNAWEGRGMANMRRRCREIGASLEINNKRSGLEVVLTKDIPSAF